MVWKRVSRTVRTEVEGNMSEAAVMCGPAWRLQSFLYLFFGRADLQEQLTLHSSARATIATSPPLFRPFSTSPTTHQFSPPLLPISLVVTATFLNFPFRLAPRRRRPGPKDNPLPSKLLDYDGRNAEIVHLALKIMFGAPWICRRCLSAAWKPASRRNVHFLSGEYVSPALLNRARSLAQEHSKLSQRTSESFDAKIARRIGELQGTAEALKEWESTKQSLEELQALLEDPTTDEELRELASEDVSATSTHLQTLSRALTTSLTPKHPFAALPCLLEIRPGAGGGEAALFAGDLLRMYRAYCSRKNLRATLLKYEDTDGTTDSSGDSPLQEAILEIESPGAYDALRSEAGVHRVQRVPATESKGRTHTSAVSVLVLPSFPTSGGGGGGGGDAASWEADMNDPQSDYYVNPQDVRTDVMRARGAGGQHVNTTDSAVRLTHLPTNTVVSMQDSRSQHRNREKAWNVLRSRLAQARREAREEEMLQLRRSVVGVARMGRGDKVRTYNWGQQRVTDHRSGLSVHNLDEVMQGGEELDKIIQSVRTWMGEREIENVIMEDEENRKS